MEADGSERYVLVLENTMLVGFVAWTADSGFRLGGVQV